MQKIYFFSLLLISSFSINAQLVLTQSYNPLPGDLDVQYGVTNTNVPLGSSGAGQTWNYSGLNISWSSSFTNSYVAMSSVSNASLFPSGTIALDYGMGYHGVLEMTGSVFRYIGDAAPSVSNCNVYSNPITYYTLPFGFGSSSYDTFGYTTLTDALTGTVTTTGDGTGTLLTPGLSFSNVLKMRQSYYEIDITGSYTYSITGIQDLFFAAGNKFPILTVSSTTVSTTSSTVVSIASSANISRFGFVGIQETIKETDFSIFPNPTSNKEVTINFNSNESDNYSVVVTNTIGQEVKTVELTEMAPGQHSSNIDLQGLNSGIYFMKLKNKTGESIQKLIIE